MLVFGCSIPLANFNKSGRCGTHYFIKRGTRMKDGTVPRPKEVPVFVQEGTAPDNEEIDAAKGRLDEGTVSAIQGLVGEHEKVFHQSIKEQPPVWAGGADLFAAGAEMYPKPPALDEGFVSMKAPTEALDRFWARMTVDDELRIIEREIFGS